MNKLVTAVKLCTDCEDHLCTDCVHTQKAIKALASNRLINKDIQTDKGFITKITCSGHPKMGLEFNCSNHETLCCRTCSENIQRACGKMLTIDVAARGIKH